jgi:glycosyltransferase involved in cell wall biosynthesis
MKFSVLMSLYDKEDPAWFEECLSSITCKQSLQPDEIVIVEDGPLKPELTSIIDDFSKSQKIEFVIVKFAVNVGLSRALRAGLYKCKNEYVARMDTDDIAFPKRFEKQLDYLKNNDDVKILGSSAVIIDEKSRLTGKIRVVPENNEDIYNELWTCPIIHPSVMFKKSYILAAGSYSKKLKRRQDYDLWFRCALNGYSFHNLSEPLIKYRVTSLTNKKNSIKVTLQQAKIGIVGSYKLKLGIKAYIGVFFPLFKSLLPQSLRPFVLSFFSRFDSRN